MVQGEGAILEAVGAFEELRVARGPKGPLATVSVGDSFECHVRLKEVASASFVSKEKPDGKALHIVRLLDKEGESLLSAILHEGPDGYEDGAVSFYERLREKFGATVDITDDLEGED